MKEDPIMSSATKWRIPIGIAVVVLLIVVALILALLLSGAENGEGMQASTSATTAAPVRARGNTTPADGLDRAGRSEDGASLQ
jgi:hypothetical protein